MNALILCAGLGSRLRPFSERTPKPLTPLGRQTLLEKNLEALQEIQVDSVYLNAHHLGEQIIEFGRKCPRIGHVFLEDTILGTGEPLFRAWEYSPAESLLVLNGDVYHNLHLKRFVEECQKHPDCVHLLLRDHPPVNTVQSDDQGYLTGILQRWGREGTQRGTYTGIAWYPKDCLGMIGATFDIRNVWQKLVLQNKIRVVKQTDPGLFWIDAGTPEGLWKVWEQQNEQKKTSRGNFWAIDIRPELEAICENCLILEAPLNLLEGYREEILGKDFVWKH